MTTQTHSQSQSQPQPQPNNPFDVQVGGNHYKTLAIQPAEFCQRNKIPFCEATAIKYLCRHKSKGGIEDLRKAIHFIELAIEMEYGEAKGEKAAEEPARGAIEQPHCMTIPGATGQMYEHAWGAWSDSWRWRPQVLTCANCCNPIPIGDDDLCKDCRAALLRCQPPPPKEEEKPFTPGSICVLCGKARPVDTTETCSECNSLIAESGDGQERATST